jgi:hypothetical protein
MNDLKNLHRKLLVFSADPGGAECLSPVMWLLNNKTEILLLCKGTAARVFKRLGHQYINTDDMTFEAIKNIVEGHVVGGVLTSASSLPENDMTEKMLWVWAKEKNIPSIAVLDQWENYINRFSGRGTGECMMFMPDKICVMDELVKSEMMRDGFLEDRLCITGHPAIESFAKMIAAYRKSPNREMLAESRSGLRLLFFSQPIKKYYGNMLGYDECTVLRDIVSAFSALEKAIGEKIDLLCKLHPKNSKEDFRTLDRKKRAVARFIVDEYPNCELIVGSDIIVGISSIMLLHSLLAGVPTISYIPGDFGAANLPMPVRIGAISRAQNKNDLTNLMIRLMTDKKFLDKYVAGQKICKDHDGAGGNVASLVLSVMDK